MKPPPRPGPLATIVVAALAFAVFWFGLRSVVRRTREASAPAASASVATSSSEIGSTGSGVWPLPKAPIDRAGQRGVARLDVTMRIDGLDVALDQRPTCRDGARRWIGRAQGDAPGSFDQAALGTCLASIARDRRDRMLVAVIARAGSQVPTTYRDALEAELRRLGVEDVVVDPRGWPR